MLSPRVGGGVGYPRDFDSGSFPLGRNFDTWVPTLGREFGSKTCLLQENFPEGWGNLTFTRCPGVGNLTQASMKMSKSPGSARPRPTLGLNIDRCISFTCGTAWLINLFTFMKRTWKLTVHDRWHISKCCISWKSIPFWNFKSTKMSNSSTNWRTKTYKFVRHLWLGDLAILWVKWAGREAGRRQD